MVMVENHKAQIMNAPGLVVTHLQIRSEHLEEFCMIRSCFDTLLLHHSRVHRDFDFPSDLVLWQLAISAYNPPCAEPEVCYLPGSAALAKQLL